MTPDTAAIVDIGSNSIKLLVAARTPEGTLRAIHTRTLDVRISAGISQTPPRLSEEGIAAGVDAVSRLLQEASAYSPQQRVLVATSAVRDAVNGADFRQRVAVATGETVRILSGAEEAALIGRGLVADPALATLDTFYVFDLGGGSLECLSFEHRRITDAVSLPLGCVRLTERFIRDPSQPFESSDAAAITAQVDSTLLGSSFQFRLGENAQAVFTGGTMTTARVALGEPQGKTLATSSAYVFTDELRTLLSQIAPLTLEQRKRLPGIPSARADVFPVGLATILALAQHADVNGFWHSLYNLRWGLASELLTPNTF